MKYLAIATVSGLWISMSGWAQERPNIVMVMADDLGGRDLAAYGNRFNETPNIDKLARLGMVFNHAYAAPVCSASRASIQSGQYPARVGIFDFIMGHWRTGTTFLQELLWHDPRLASPSNYQVYATNHFLLTEHIAEHYLKFLFDVFIYSDHGFI